MKRSGAIDALKSYRVAVPLIQEWTNYNHKVHRKGPMLYAAVCQGKPLYIGQTQCAKNRLGKEGHKKIRAIRSLFRATRLVVFYVPIYEQLHPHLRKDLLKSLEEIQINLYLPPGNHNVAMDTAMSFDRRHAYYHGRKLVKPPPRWSR